MRLSRSNIRKGVVFLLFNIIVVFVLLEIAVRLWGYSARYIYDPIYQPFEASAEIPYVLKPDLHNARGRGVIWINTDALGLRNTVAGEAYQEKQDQEYRIAIVGDSYTFGTGVANEETFAEVLEDFLNDSQQQVAVKVFNFGVPAYSVKEMAATLRHRMLQVEPDLVIMSFIASDFNLNRTPQQVDRWGYTTNTIDGTLAMILRRLHLSHVVRDIIFQLRRDRNQVSETNDDELALPASYEYVIEFKETAVNHQTPYLIITLSGYGENGLDKMNIYQQFREDDILYYDLTTIREEFTRETYQTSPFDHHPSALVHQRIGERLGEYILQNFLDDQ